VHVNNTKQEKKMNNMEHAGYRKNCFACRFHCPTCGNRAKDKPDGRFLAENEGNHCTYDCKGSKVENNLFCYHCKDRVDKDQAFCQNGRNCFKLSRKRGSPISLPISCCF